LMPLTFHELKPFSLDNYLLYGGLPQVVTDDEPFEELDTYVNLYLREEIQAEALIRKIQAFSTFLRFAALTSGTMINYAKLSSDTGIPASTIREYYQVLEDTLIGFTLPAWTKTQKRKAASTAKFYLFDIGVRNMIAGINALPPASDSYGQAFEHFIAMELRAYLSYRRKKIALSYWRSLHQHEVDFILGDDIAIEVKTSNNITSKHLKGLKILAEEKICKKYFLIGFDKNHRMSGEIEIIHWEDFLHKLWQGEII